MTTEPVKLPRRSDGPRPTYLGNPHLDNMLSMILELAQEMWVLDERLSKLENSAASSVGEIDEVKAQAARAERLEAFMARLLRSTIASATESTTGETYEDVVRRISEV